jgi:hypothetical protein
MTTSFWGSTVSAAPSLISWFCAETYDEAIAKRAPIAMSARKADEVDAGRSDDIIFETIQHEMTPANERRCQVDGSR